MRFARACLMLFVAVVSCATTYGAQRTFVSAGTGSDANPCSRPSPCRNFAAALPLTDANGEVVVLDSGGYGPVTITQSVSIVAPGGTHAGITAFTGNAITINATATGHVALRNLVLSSQGAAAGISATSAAAVYVDDCVITGFGSYGIYFVPTNSDSRLYASRSVIRRNQYGIYAAGSAGGVDVTLDTVRLLGNSTGIAIQDADATIRRSVMAGSGNDGVRGESGSRIIIEDSVAASNAYGIYANNGAVISFVRSAATSNSLIGVTAAFAGSTVYVSDSTIAGNLNGVATGSGGVALTRGTNTLQANTTDGTFDGTFGAN